MKPSPPSHILTNDDRDAYQMQPSIQCAMSRESSSTGSEFIGCGEASDYSCSPHAPAKADGNVYAQEAHALTANNYRHPYYKPEIR